MKAIAFLGKCATQESRVSSRQRWKKETSELPAALYNLLSLKKPHLGSSKVSNKVIKFISKTDEKMH